MIGLTPQTRVFVTCVKRVATVLVFVCAGVLATALTMPISEAGLENSVGERRLKRIPEVKSDIQPLLNSLAGRELIRPASMQPALKDDGSAQRLLKLLKLQGVIEFDSELVAYVQVEKEGVRTVRAGDKLLEFVVEKVQPSSVTLSLNGVTIALGH